MRKPGLKINLFITKQICGCDSQPGCCAALGQSKNEIAELTGALRKITQVDTKINDIRDIKTADEFPKAAALFKKYGYNCLPIVMVDGEIVAYGIPDEEFIVNSIKKVKPR
ncbi:MAG: hypothetical protein PHC71_00590 [Candidatus Omnitrophica bacterium]|nr:hypothetical protein [Candidatus Omnitrophota bacterium]